ncbi:MAG: sugar transferase, partial [Thermoanaerobaculales bacterium]|nr:sugar transferase [Thermoanaerobaculales bacterium]
VALSSRGPVLFRQQRVGRGGRPFTMLKFRTMRVGGGGAQVTAAGDGRVTAVGRLLRRLKLDELPELVNVLGGELALVGPRPEVPRFVDLGDPRWRAVLEERPGTWRSDLAVLAATAGALVGRRCYARVELDEVRARTAADEGRHD